MSDKELGTAGVIDPMNETDTVLNTAEELIRKALSNLQRIPFWSECKANHLQNAKHLYLNTRMTEDEKSIFAFCENKMQLGVSYKLGNHAFSVNRASNGNTYFRKNEIPKYDLSFLNN